MPNGRKIRGSKIQDMTKQEKSIDDYIIKVEVMDRELNIKS